MFFFHHAPVVRDAGKRCGYRQIDVRSHIVGSRVGAARLVVSGWRLPGQLEVGIAFVVPKQDVVPGAQRLDQIVFKQQGLGFGSHHRGLHGGNPAHHLADPRSGVVVAEIAGNPLLEVDRLTHVQDRAGSIKVAVDAGQRRQRCRLREQALILLFPGRVILLWRSHRHAATDLQALGVGEEAL